MSKDSWRKVRDDAEIRVLIRELMRRYDNTRTRWISEGGSGEEFDRRFSVWLLGGQPPDDRQTDRRGK